MPYSHILVAVDLSEDSALLLSKGAALAHALNAKISLIHIDASYVGLYSGLSDISVAEAHHRIMEEARHQLVQLAQREGVTITHSLVGGGDMAKEIIDTITDCEIDLVIFGHHQDFWSTLLSSVNHLINNTPVDMLLVPLDN
ncbi:universal stress protein [Veronia pacifica]|uniref:Universal stress protein n=1 Tax=Veronia pacifica TaxID=1080227 RepID=A0A1C3ECB0_9GAMM|nr:universal stress protein [Veronia pacifica]ODA30873.1 universal stress global response regulator UspA [Veronia pacifica]